MRFIKKLSLVIQELSSHFWMISTMSRLLQVHLRTKRMPKPRGNLFCKISQMELEIGLLRILQKCLFSLELLESMIRIKKLRKKKFSKRSITFSIKSNKKTQWKTCKKDWLWWRIDLKVTKIWSKVNKELKADRRSN